MRALSIRPAPARSVAVLPDGEGLVSVAPIPRIPTDPRPAQFNDIDDARLFAAGLGLTKGWPVIDLMERQS